MGGFVSIFILLSVYLSTREREREGERERGGRESSGGACTWAGAQGESPKPTLLSLEPHTGPDLSTPRSGAESKQRQTLNRLSRQAA